jgi:hypothetical protein
MWQFRLPRAMVALKKRKTTQFFNDTVLEFTQCHFWDTQFFTVIISPPGLMEG